ncbi:hypothetical protein MMC24_007943 [Lignoscripta atroalba]|nr:hypothetical protein [Lignoscripta atroalba]
MKCQYQNSLQHTPSPNASTLPKSSTFCAAKITNPDPLDRSRPPSHSCPDAISSIYRSTNPSARELTSSEIGDEFIFPSGTTVVWALAEGFNFYFTTSTFLPAAEQQHNKPIETEDPDYIANGTGKRHEIFLASKFGISMANGQHTINGSAEYCKRAYKASLKKLGTDSFDLYYVHCVNPETPMEETTRVRAAPKAEGRIKHIGLSEVSSTTLRRANKIAPVTAVQMKHSPVEREIENASGTNLRKHVPHRFDEGYSQDHSPPTNRSAVQVICVQLISLDPGSLDVHLTDKDEAEIRNFVEGVEPLGYRSMPSGLALDFADTKEEA